MGTARLIRKNIPSSERTSVKFGRGISSRVYFISCRYCSLLKCLFGCLPDLRVTVSELEGISPVVDWDSSALYNWMMKMVSVCAVQHRFCKGCRRRRKAEEGVNWSQGKSEPDVVAFPDRTQVRTDSLRKKDSTQHMHKVTHHPPASPSPSDCSPRASHAPLIYPGCVCSPCLHLPLCLCTGLPGDPWIHIFAFSSLLNLFPNIVSCCSLPPWPLAAFPSSS